MTQSRNSSHTAKRADDNDMIHDIRLRNAKAIKKRL